MNNFKNNHRRPRFRSNSDRNYRKRNGNGHKVNGNFNNNPEFKRRNPGKNNQNAAKLVDKYNDLAREALSKGDKILSENYFQHADHFTRILAEKENLKLSKEKDNKNTIEVVSDNTKVTPSEAKNQEKQILKT